MSMMVAVYVREDTPIYRDPASGAATVYLDGFQFAFVIQDVKRGLEVAQEIVDACTKKAADDAAEAKRFES